MLERITKFAGFDWRTNIALLGGVAAKEVIVSTLGTAYSLGEVDAEHAAPLAQRIAKDPEWNKIKAISFMVFVLLYSPCFISIITMIQESNWRWGVFSIVFNTLFAYLLSTFIYQIGIRFF
jgi:ferrous iron transport protein B